MPGTRRVAWATAWLLRLGILATAAWTLAHGDLVLGGTALVMLAVALAPPAVQRFTRYRVPAVLDLVVAAAAGAHIFGHTVGLYNAVPFYDKILHFIVSLALAMMVYLVVRAWIVRARISGPGGGEPSHVFIGVVIVGLIALVGVVWELLEFVVDAALGLENQKSLVDTNADLALDVLAGVVVALGGRKLDHADGPLADARRAMEENVKRAQQDA